MSGIWLYLVIAIVMFVGGFSLSTVCAGEKVRKFRERAEDVEWRERDEKFKLHVAIDKEKEALEEDIVCAELDLIMADHAVASAQFQNTLAAS